MRLGIAAYDPAYPVSSFDSQENLVALRFLEVSRPVVCAIPTMPPCGLWKLFASSLSVSSSRRRTSQQCRRPNCSGRSKVFSCLSSRQNRFRQLELKHRFTDLGCRRNLISDRKTSFKPTVGPSENLQFRKPPSCSNAVTHRKAGWDCHRGPIDAGDPSRRQSCSFSLCRSVV